MQIIVAVRGVVRLGGDTMQGPFQSWGKTQGLKLHRALGAEYVGRSQEL
jgi:hypothetical protein